MSTVENVFLVGPMGAGKSTIGRQLAKKLGRDFYDTDKLIEARTGVSIAWIFEREGEAGFRERETRMIDEISQLSNIVMATGGGAVLAPCNRDMLRARGRVVYLTAELEHLVRRTARDTQRPLLQKTDRRAQLKTLLEQRDPLYREVADVIIKSGQHSVAQTVRMVLEQLNRKEEDEAQ